VGEKAKINGQKPMDRKKCKEKKSVRQERQKMNILFVRQYPHFMAYILYSTIAKHIVTNVIIFVSIFIRTNQRNIPLKIPIFIVQSLQQKGLPEELRLRD
jgi:hypothetical protein